MSLTAATMIVVLIGALVIIGVFFGLSYLIKKELGLTELPAWTWLVTMLAAASAPGLLMGLLRLAADIIMWIV